MGPSETHRGVNLIYSLTTSYPYISWIDLFTEVRGELALFEGEEVDGSEEDHDDSTHASVDSEDDFRPWNLQRNMSRNLFLCCNTPWVFMSIPPKTAPQKRPKPWWTPWRTPWADGLNSASVLCEMKEQQAAHTAACVIPEEYYCTIIVVQDERIYTTGSSTACVIPEQFRFVDVKTGSFLLTDWKLRQKALWEW